MLWTCRKEKEVVLEESRERGRPMKKRVNVIRRGDMRGCRFDGEMVMDMWYMWEAKIIE